MIIKKVPNAKENDSELKKLPTEQIAHKKDVKIMYEAHRLEGQVKNRGIKNVGHQKKKSKA